MILSAKILLLSFLVGQFARFDMGRGIILHLNDVVAVIVLGAWFVRHPFLAVAQIRQNPLSRPIGLWILTMLLSLAVNFPRLGWEKTLISSLYLVRWSSFAGLFFLFSAALPIQRPKIIRLLAFAGLALAVSGWWQYLFLPDVSFLAAYHWDDHYFRLVVPFLDPGFTGISLLLAFLLYFHPALSSTIRYFKLALLSLGYSAFLLTYSRASYVAYLLAITFLAIKKQSGKLLGKAIIIFLISLFVLPRTAGEGTKLTRENSLLARINNWQQTLIIWTEHPFFGVGFNSYRYTQIEKGRLPGRSAFKTHSGATADSSLLLVLATTGLTGFLAYINLLSKSWQLGRRSAIFQVSLVAILVHSWFNNTMFYPWIMEWLWILLAVTY